MNTAQLLDTYRDILATAYADDMAAQYGDLSIWTGDYNRAMSETVSDLLTAMARRAAARRAAATGVVS